MARFSSSTAGKDEQEGSVYELFKLQILKLAVEAPAQRRLRGQGWKERSGGVVCGCFFVYGGWGGGGEISCLVTQDRR